MFSTKLVAFSTKTFGADKPHPGYRLQLRLKLNPKHLPFCSPCTAKLRLGKRESVQRTNQLCCSAHVIMTGIMIGAETRVTES